MVQPETEMSLGDLVAAATGNLTKVVHSEIELAKIELKEDAKRAAVSGAMFGVAAVLGVMIIIFLSFTLAYALIGLGFWQWAGFATVALLYALVAGVLLLLGQRWIKKISGPTRTKRTLEDGVKMLKRARSS